MQNTEKAKIPKISLKRVHGQNYTKSVSIKHENTDSNTDDFVPPTETRPRRGRKPKVARLIPGPTQTEHFPEQITPDINTDSNNDDFVPATETRLRRGRKAKVAHLTPGPSQMEHCSEQITADIPGPSQAIDLCGEESMVEKISEILLRHNFQNRKSNTDVAQLLANVKKIVKQGYMYPTDSSDDVTASIAQVLLTQRQASHALNDNTPEPTFNSILSESTVPQPDLSVIIPDPVDMSSQTSQAENEVIVPGKTRRRKPAILRSRYSATQRQATHALNDNTPEPTFNSVLSESTEPQPDLSVIIPDPVDIPSQTSQAENEVIVPDKTRRRKPAILRSRYSATPASSSLEPESILGFSHNNEEVLHNNEEVLPDSRKKRRAAIAAEKQFDLLSNAVIINLDDEHDTTDGDFVPNIVKKTEKSSKIKRRNNYNETTQEENKNAKESTLSSKITFIESDTEISEEAVAKSMSKSNYKPGPKRYKEKVSKENRKEPVQVEDQPTLIENNDLCSTSGVRDLTASPTASATVQSISTADDDEENIPLPLSLLTNKNFINIVAHTYLNGNPMLDADAATLAAKYSTLKALKEAEQTGKDIVSGAIYDIAVKVIGKHLFKRMANIEVDNNKSGSSILVEEEDFTIQLKDNLEVEQPDVTIKLKDKKQIKTESKENSRLRTRASKEKKSSVSNIVNSKTNEKNVTNIADNFSSHVVPVGMIQSAGSLPSGEFASNESILPHDDEDDMLFISSDIPPSREKTNSTVMTPTQPVQSSITTNTENSNTLNLMQESPVCLSDGAPASLSTTPTPAANVITIARGKIMLHTSVVSGASKNTKQLPTQSLPSETICLDSDDEDSVTPVTTSASLSVSTQQTSNDEPEVLSTPTDQSIAESIQGVPQNSLLIRQISVGNIPKFVLVPTNTFSKYLSKDLQRETTTTQSPVTMTTASVATSSKSYPPATTKHSSATTTKQSLTAETSQDSATTTKHRSAITSPQILTTKNTPILSTTTPSAACLSKLKQAQCKPGDIIKISDKGEIEVLQVKKEAGAKSSTKSSVSVSEVMKSIPNKSANKKSHESKKISLINDTTKQATNMSDAEKAIVADKILSQPSSSIQRKSDMVTLKARTLSVSSSSSSSRPTTPIDNNPLSILKDVVHIQAAEDKTEKKPSSRSQKSNVPNVYVAHRSGSKQSAKLLDKNSKDSIIRQKLQIKRIVPGKDNKMLKDLLNKKSAKPIAKIANAVKDGLKSIVIDGAITPKKLSTPIDLVGFGTVKAGSGASMLRTKIEIKKRSSTSESSPLKKTKTEQMTLKDFNIEDIDDLDDIIELE